MKTIAIVGARGQITIPKPLRRSLGIRPGTELRFEEREGTLVARRLDAGEPVDLLVGLGGRRADVDALLTAMRGPAWDPEHDPRG